MAKAITKTTAKVSLTHDRVALTVKFPCGHVLKTAVNRYSDSFKVTAPAHATSIPDCEPLWKFICSKPIAGETHGARFDRLAKFFESTSSLKDAISDVS